MYFYLNNYNILVYRLLGLLLTRCIPAIPLGTYRKKLKEETWTRISVLVVTGELFIITKRWKQPSVHPHKETWYVHAMEYYSAMKRNVILIHFTTWMDLENIMPRERSQTQKDKYCMLPFTWGTWVVTFTETESGIEEVTRARRGRNYYLISPEF